MPFLALAINENGKEHLEAGGGMKCSNFKGLYMETDRCKYLPRTHIYLYMCCVHIHTRHSGSQAVQLPVQTHHAWLAVVGEVLGHRGLCKEWHRGVVKELCALQLFSKWRGSCFPGAVGTEDPLWQHPWTCRGHRDSNEIGSPPLWVTRPPVVKRLSLH